jgi:putative phosphoribosyl transferase
MPFKNRVDAGRKLAKALAVYKNQDPVVLALPRGGVPVAAEVCAALKAPLDLILVRKIGVPFQPELAMGAVVDGGAPVAVRNEDVIQLATLTSGRSARSATMNLPRSNGDASGIWVPASVSRSLVVARS